MARRKSEAANKAAQTRGTRREQEVAALERELAGYEARAKATKDSDESEMLKGRIADTKKAIAAAKKGHGVGPATRVTDPTGGSNPAPVAAEADVEDPTE